jgi:hypothetical protein
MVESKNQGLIDAPMKKHLFKAGKCVFKLFWIAGKFFIVKHAVPPWLLHRYFVELSVDACKEMLGIAYHSCAFAGLLAKNMVFRLVSIGGKLFTVSASASFINRTEPER